MRTFPTTSSGEQQSNARCWKAKDGIQVVKEGRDRESWCYWGAGLYGRLVVAGGGHAGGVEGDADDGGLSLLAGSVDALDGADMEWNKNAVDGKEDGLAAAVCLHHEVRHSRNLRHTFVGHNVIDLPTEIQIPHKTWVEGPTERQAKTRGGGAAAAQGEESRVCTPSVLPWWGRSYPCCSSLP